MYESDARVQAQKWADRKVDGKSRIACLNQQNAQSSAMSAFTGSRQRTFYARLRGPMLSGLRNTGSTSVSTYNNIPKHVNTLEWAKPRCCRSLQRRRSVDGRVYTDVCQRMTGCSLSAWLLECRRLPQGSSECQNFFFSLLAGAASLCRMPQ